jgi:hypothetical protein
LVLIKKKLNLLTMKKLFLPMLAIILLAGSAQAQVNLNSIKSKAAGIGAAKGLTDSDIAAGLKEALTIGSVNAASVLSQVDGFNSNPRVRIPFPEEVQQVATKLRQMGMGAKVDEFELTLNRAAELAAKEAAPIFVNAVKGMSFDEARKILTGADNSATLYLQDRTTPQLYSSFIPHVTTALNATQATARWEELTTLYNKIPMVKKVDTDLSRYTTNKALGGLFIIVADEELKIRKDPSARVNDVLQRVFGKS